VADRGTACRSCGGNLETFLDLGPQPLANGLMPLSSSPADDTRFPLALACCRDCGLAQLRETVRPDVLFRDYAYLTRYSGTLVDSFSRLAPRIREELGLDGRDLVYDIGGNDGTLLGFYRRLGVRVLDVDPSPAAEMARAEGIPVCPEFLDEAVAERLVFEYGQGAAVHIHNCLAHCPDLPGVLRALRLLIGDAGTLVIETPSALDLVRNVRVDCVYHEHVFYFSMTSLGRALAAADLYPWRVERTPNHGRSLLVFASAQPREGTGSVQKELRREAAAGADRPTFYRALAAGVASARPRLRGVLEQVFVSGRVAVAYGAAAKTTCLLNVFGIDVPWIRFAVDHSPLKVGRRIPGTHIEIRPPDILAEWPPDMVLITAWNLADEIVRNNAHLVARGVRFVTPLPKPTVVA